MIIDTLSRRALLEAKQHSNYTPRHKIWRSAGYVAPNAEEFAELRRAAHRCLSGVTDENETEEGE